MGDRREPIRPGRPIPADFPDRDRVWRIGEEGTEWVEAGNTVICDPNGGIVAGPLRHEEGILTAEVELAEAHAARRMFDPVGHYHRPDVSGSRLTRGPIVR